jgi:hypothetical protein
MTLQFTLPTDAEIARLRGDNYLRDMSMRGFIWLGRFEIVRAP